MHIGFIYFQLRCFEYKTHAKKFKLGTGEMGQQLRALVAFPEDLSLAPSAHEVANLLLTPVAEDTTSSNLLGYCTHVVLIAQSYYVPPSPQSNCLV